MKIASFFDKETRYILPYWGKAVHLKNERACDILGMKFRDPIESIVEMSYTLIETGVFKTKVKVERE